MALHGPNWPCRIKNSSSGIKIVLTCIIHYYKSYWPTLGSLRHPWGTFWPQKALLGAPEGLGGPGGSRFGPNCHQLVWMGWNHCYQTLWPGIWPLLAPRDPKRVRFGPKCPFWGSYRDPDRPLRLDMVPTAADWSDCVVTMVNTHFSLVTALTGSFLDFLGPKQFTHV